MKQRRLAVLLFFMLALILSVTLSSAAAQEGNPIVPAGELMTETEAEYEAMQVAAALVNPSPEKPLLSSLEAEVAQTASPPHNKIETEWNGNFVTANPIEVGDVMFGTIRNDTDEDFFVIDAPFVGSLLFDIDARVIGSYHDAVICLYDHTKTEITCNDDSESLDSLIYYGAGAWPMYVRVRDYNYPEVGGEDFFYTLSVSNPLLISATKNGKVDRMEFKKSDILAWQELWGGNEKWSMFFDASDLGIKGDLEAVGNTSNPLAISLVLGTTQRKCIWDDSLGYCTSQLVRPQDILEFVPERHPAGLHGFGHYTAGTLRFYNVGKDHCLKTGGEKIDVILAGNSISTSGRAKLCSGVKFNDEDIFNKLDGTLVFDGSQVPGLAKEDVVAANYRGQFGTECYYLTILGKGRIHSHKVDQKQIFKICHDFDEGVLYEWGGLYWDGRAHNFKYSIDAINQ